MSLCFTHRKNVQLNTPEWVAMVDVDGDSACAYRPLVALLKDEFGWHVDINAPRWSPPADAAQRFLFPRFEPQQCNDCFDFNPAPKWDKRASASYATLLTQFRHMLREVLGFDQPTADAYDLSSFRSGGDTFLASRGVSKEDRMLAGHWATVSMEARYNRLTALEHARRTCSGAAPSEPGVAVPLLRGSPPRQ